MTPVMPTSTSNISLIPGAAFTTRKNNCLTRCRILRKSTKQKLFAQEFILPLSTSVRLFPLTRTCGLHHKTRILTVSATGTDVALEEPDSPIADKDSVDALGLPSAVEKSDESSLKEDASLTRAQSKRSRPVRKSEMPPVKNEELVPGATFTGKVRSIQPFGAFVDFGAFTDGLVHVSRLSDSFVKDVGTVVSVGQEVKVRLLEANTETGRISLTMRDSDSISKLQQPPADSDRTRPPRTNTQKSNQKKDEMKKTSKFVKGQDLEGTVKNLTRAGAFISLPEGEEGFLPTSEESDEGFGNIMGGSSLQAGQEVSIRVLRISRGQVTLTMKREEDVGALDSKLSQGTVHTATNPFLLAFRKNKDIAAFLDEREKEEDPAENSKGLTSVPTAGDEMVENAETSQEVDVVANTAGDALSEITNEDEDPESVVLQRVDGAVQNLEEEAEMSSEILSPDGNVSSVDQMTEAAPATVEVENDGESDDTIVKAESQIQIPSAESEISSPTQFQHEKVKPNPGNPEGNVSSVDQMAEAAPATLEVENDGESEDTMAKAEAPIQIPSARSETSPTQFEHEKVEPNPDNPEGSLSSVDQLTEASPAMVEVENDGESDDTIAKAEEQRQKRSAESEISSPTPFEHKEVEPRPDEVEGIVSSEGQITEASLATSEVENGGEFDDTIVKAEAQIQIPSAESEISSSTPVEHENAELNPDKNSSITNSKGQIDVPSSQEITSEEIQVNEVVENQIDSTTMKDKVQIQTPTADSENPSISPVEDENVGPVPKQNGSVPNPNGQGNATFAKESTTKAAISPALVKRLRQETGAGMMDCKKALSETGGDIVKAQEYLRKKGLASADKKASRATAEGRIGSYIHDSRIGVLIEINCETDFVSRGDIFKELVDDLAMQVAACPQVQYLITEDVPKETLEKEKEIEMQKEDLLSKPEQIRSKIVEGRIRKRLEELALLEQPYIKNDKIVVKDWVKQTIATIGENMKVKRFVRYNLGEGLEKKSQDFAAEVAAQTAAKLVPTPAKEQPAAVEANKTDEKPAKVTISAALVKLLREETGAGMMDCKKALSETGGNLDKAQEYLRKKGLSAADKKSSRLTAEGRIGSYVHDSRIGVLIEVNSETDFVGRSEKFKELVDDLAMQVVACPLVQYVSIEDIPESIVSKEKELEMQREDILSKPEKIRERIVAGRVSKRLGELALLEQPFIKNDGILVKDLVKQTVAALGENIKVRRFVRFTLGEASDAKTEIEA